MNRKKIFLSYSSADRDGIIPIVNALVKVGLDVWWDRHIVGGALWSDEIDRQLADSQIILAIITENAERSKRDYIFCECDYGREHGKLIPVIVGSGVTTFLFRGLVTRLQCFRSNTLESIAESDIIRAVHGICEGNASINQSLARPESLSSIESIDRWFHEIEGSSDPQNEILYFSLAATLAIIGGTSFTRVHSFAFELAQSLCQTELGKPLTVPQDFPRRRSKILERLEAMSDAKGVDTNSQSNDCVRFCNPSHADALLEQIWSEYGSRRPILFDWMENIVPRLLVEEIKNVGVTIGILAQKRFKEMHQNYISRWLMLPDTRFRYLTDVAYAISASEPFAANLLRDAILSWSNSSSKEMQIVALRLACGFVGARLPTLSIEVLSRIANSSRRMHMDVLVEMQDALKKLLDFHSTGGDDSLFQLHSLVTKLEEWILRETTFGLSMHSRFSENPYPLLFFVLALDGIPISSKPNGFSSGFTVESLMSNPKTKASTCNILSVALQRPLVRGIKIQSITTKAIKRWVDDVAQSQINTTPADPLLELARDLWCRAGTDDDRSRILHLFSKIYEKNQICNYETINKESQQ